MLLIFGIAIIAYPVCALGVLRLNRAALAFAVLGPLTGGVLIFLGLISPDLDYEILIPGTFGDEITWIGFLTLVLEPIASFSALVLLKALAGPGQ